jgi:hypothetical protein
VSSSTYSCVAEDRVVQRKAVFEGTADEEPSGNHADYIAPTNPPTTASVYVGGAYDNNLTAKSMYAVKTPFKFIVDNGGSRLSNQVIVNSGNLKVCLNQPTTTTVSERGNMNSYVHKPGIASTDDHTIVSFFTSHRKLCWDLDSHTSYNSYGNYGYAQPNSPCSGTYLAKYPFNSEIYFWNTVDSNGDGIVDVNAAYGITNISNAFTDSGNASYVQPKYTGCDSAGFITIPFCSPAVKNAYNNAPLSQKIINACGEMSQTGQCILDDTVAYNNYKYTIYDVSYRNFGFYYCSKKHTDNHGNEEWCGESVSYTCKYGNDNLKYGVSNACVRDFKFRYSGGAPTVNVLECNK